MKPIYLSKTIITALLGLITLIVDGLFNLGLTDALNAAINNILVSDNTGTVIKINWAALLSFLSMLILRLFTKKPISAKPKKRINK